MWTFGSTTISHGTPVENQWPTKGGLWKTNWLCHDATEGMRRQTRISAEQKYHPSSAHHHLEGIKSSQLALEETHPGELRQLLHVVGTAKSYFHAGPNPLYLFSSSAAIPTGCVLHLATEEGGNHRNLLKVTVCFKLWRAAT